MITKKVLMRPAPNSCGRILLTGGNDMLNSDFCRLLLTSPPIRLGSNYYSFQSILAHRRRLAIYSTNSKLFTRVVKVDISNNLYACGQIVLIRLRCHLLPARLARRHHGAEKLSIGYCGGWRLVGMTCYWLRDNLTSLRIHARDLRNCSEPLTRAGLHRKFSES